MKCVTRRPIFPAAPDALMAATRMTARRVARWCAIGSVAAGLALPVSFMVAAAEEIQTPKALIDRIDSIAKNMSVSQPPPPIVHPKVSEPYVFWDMDLHGDVPFSGSTGSIGDLRYYGLKNANPLWSAKSVIFYKETKTYVEQSVFNSPGHRETIYLSAWIVNIETGESTGFFLELRKQWSL